MPNTTDASVRVLPPNPTFDDVLTLLAARGATLLRYDQEVPSHATRHTERGDQTSASPPSHPPPPRLPKVFAPSTSLVRAVLFSARPQLELRSPAALDAAVSHFLRRITDDAGRKMHDKLRRPGDDFDAVRRTILTTFDAPRVDDATADFSAAVTFLARLLGFGVVISIPGEPDSDYLAPCFDRVIVLARGARGFRPIAPCPRPVHALYEERRRKATLPAKGASCRDLTRLMERLGLDTRDPDTGRTMVKAAMLERLKSIADRK